jgi:transposase
MPRMRRTFAAEFKARVVSDLLTGAASQAELSRKHSLKPDLIAQWKVGALDRLVELFAGDDRVEQKDAHIAELQQLIGRQAYELEILKKASRLLNGRSSNGGRSS